jgi:hypothetical protein
MLITILFSFVELHHLVFLRREAAFSKFFWWPSGFCDFDISFTVYSKRFTTAYLGVLWYGYERGFWAFVSYKSSARLSLHGFDRFFACCTIMGITHISDGVFSDMERTFLSCLFRRSGWVFHGRKPHPDDSH